MRRTLGARFPKPGWATVQSVRWSILSETVILWGAGRCFRNVATGSVGLMVVVRALVRQCVRPGWRKMWSWTMRSLFRLSMRMA